MDPNETTETVEQTEAIEAHSPSATEGASSSDAAATEPKTAEEAIRRDFLEKYGDGDTEETDVEEADAETAEAEQTPESEEENVAPADTDDAEDDKFRIPDDQFKALPDGVRQRLGYLNARAKKAERELTTARQQVEPLKDAHERFTKLQTYVQDNGIEPQNVTLAFDAMARMSKGDYKGFIDAIKPFYDHALQATGGSILPELQQRVDDGYLSEDDARELTKARAQSEALTGRMQSVERQMATERQTREQAASQQRIVAAVNEREAHYKTSDPDYALKSQAVRSAVEMVLGKGAVPQSPEDAVKLIDDAYALVNANFARPVTPKATPPRPAVSSAPRGATKPTSSYEAVLASLLSHSD